MSKKILVAALDWGLGHASRCIPIIRQLTGMGHPPVVAAAGDALRLLEAEFPALQLIRLPAYAIRYPSGRHMAFSLARQMPRIRNVIADEKDLLGKIIQQENIGIVISDNRYGLWHPSTYNVFLCHQLFIKAPPGLTFTEALLAGIHRRMIRGFDECWVPDFAGMPNLSGSLSHGRRLPPNTRYIGPLSRFKRQIPRDGDNETPGILLLLSGPEPQRSILEDRLIGQFRDYPGRVTLVRGIFDSGRPHPPPGVIRLYSHLSSAMLEEQLHAADLVICRSGYSSIMDLAALGKKAILIPTPGQTEQEYLAGYHSSLGNFAVAFQEHSDLIRLVRSCHGMTIQNGGEEGNEVLAERIAFLIGKL